MKNGIRLVNHLNNIFNWKWHKIYLVVFNFEGDVSNTCQKKCWDWSKGPIADNMTVSLSEGATVRHLQLCDRRRVIQVIKIFLRTTEIFRNFIFFHLVQNITKNIQRIQRRVCTQERQLKILNGHYLLAVGWHWVTVPIMWWKSQHRLGISKDHLSLNAFHHWSHKFQLKLDRAIQNQDWSLGTLHSRMVRPSSITTKTQKFLKSQPDNSVQAEVESEIVLCFDKFKLYFCFLWKSWMLCSPQTQF